MNWSSALSKSQRDKGNSFERETANDLADSWGRVVRRNLGQARDSGDDITVSPFRIECKRYARIGVYKWLQQCTDACADGDVPVVVARGDREEAIVIMWYADWKRIAAGELA